MPHIADPAQADADRDGVGDACDPHPNEPRDSIAFFDPFTSLRPQWIIDGNTPTFTGDSLVMDTRGSKLVMGLSGRPIEDVLAIAGHIGAAVPTGQRQISPGRSS